MPLQVSCPRCQTPAAAVGDRAHCPEHGVLPGFWRPEQVDYQGFAEVVSRITGMPTYLPWPMSPGWSIADFGVVTDGGRTVATATTTVGISDLDGTVQVTLIAEEPGIGLGARAAHTRLDDTQGVGLGAPAIKVRVVGRSVPLWSVDAEHDGDVLAQSAFVGEAAGRWLWLVIRPAAAALLLRDEWLLADVTGFGPEALEMPFGGERSPW